MGPTRLKKTCPKCHSHLMIRESERGDFLACPKFPACRYTEPLPEGAWSKGDHGTLTLELRPENNYCKECNHTGLIPFSKNDKVVKNAWVFCECKPSEVEHYRDIRPEDFDFPMSDDYRGASYQYCGVTDPAEVPKSIETKVVEVIPQRIIVKHHYLQPTLISKKSKRSSKYD